MKLPEYHDELLRCSDLYIVMCKQECEKQRNEVVLVFRLS